LALGYGSSTLARRQPQAVIAASADGLAYFRKISLINKMHFPQEFSFSL